jgi:tetratricopeptide (TPR) repeat protein
MRGRSLLFVSLLLALGAAAWWWCAGHREQPDGSGRPAPIVLVTIDTWRADRMSPSVTPRVAALASRGAYYRTARAHAPLTLPSHVSLMTGLLPPAHGVRQNGEGLPPGVPRLATWLRAAGYDTAAFVGAFVLDRRFGLAEGFDVYDDGVTRDLRAPDRLEAERPAAVVVERAIAWLEERSPAVPYFLWVHLYDPHAPYEPPAGVPRDTNPYDAEVRYADEQVGRVLDSLAARGDLERALVLVAGDHGEGLGEHGERTHGMLLYESALRVPLIVHGPGIAPAVREDPVGLVDIAPTILARCGLAVPEQLDGIDIVGHASAPDREIYAETDYPRSAGWSALSSLVSMRWKVIASSEIELYDLDRDPGERVNLVSSRQPTASAMVDRLAEIRGPRRGASPSPQLSPEVEERLRALGYVGPAASSLAAAERAPNPATVIDGWVALERVLARLSAGAPMDALADAQALAARFPEGRLFQTTAARALQEAGRPREALAVYRMALQRFESSALLLHDLAVAARAAGDAKEAIRAERAALAIDPAYATAHNGLGLALTDVRQWGDASAAFEAAVRLDPRHAPFLMNLANARREQGDFVRAEALYTQALDLDPRQADAANGLGTVLTLTGRAPQAISMFERALELDPHFVGARLNLGIAFQQAGRTADAEAAYRAVLAAPGEFEHERQAARTLLERLVRAAR